jgi:PadR family transcriptional regulator, regulatory protein PadR
MTDGPNNLMRGTLDVLVLKALAHDDMHGLAIARWIRDGSEDAVRFEDAALYQSLHRLERQGLVASSWGRSDANRRARFYTLTSEGRGRLDADAVAFRTYAEAITRLLGTV